MNFSKLLLTTHHSFCLHADFKPDIHKGYSATVGTILQAPPLSSVPGQEPYGFVQHQAKTLRTLVAKLTMTGNLHTLPPSSVGPRAEWRQEMGYPRPLKEGVCQVYSWLSILFSFSKSVLESHWPEARAWQGQFPPWSPIRPPAQKSDKWGDNLSHTAKDQPVWAQSAAFQTRP